MDRSEESPTLSILLPVRNEGANLRIMLKILRSILEIDHEVIVITDDENDESIPIVEEIEKTYNQLRHVPNTIGLGAANATRSGVDAAKGEYILLLAADEIGPVIAIEDMLALMFDGCEFVSATRYRHGGRRLGGSLTSQILSRVGNRLFQVLSRSLFSDLTTGIKMFRRSLFHKLDLKSRNVGWAFAFEMAIKVQYANVQLGEVPIISIDRLYGGESTFKVGSWLSEYSRWFVWGLKESMKNPDIRRTSFRVRLPNYHK